MSSGPILPGATIGCLGGGQLGRMMALAARSMGYDVQVLDPDPACSARPVASRTIMARFDDVDAAVELARGCDVMTLEIEQIHPDVLDAVAAHVPMRPGSAPVYIIQDRLRQRRWLERQGFPVGAFVAAASPDDIANAVTAFGACIAKSTHGGYDGRGQVRLSDGGGAEHAWTALGARECVVEQFVEIDYEISVLVARRPGGETAVYPPSRNHHTRGILTWAVVPALVSDTMTARARSLAREIASRLDLVGLLAVECFVTKSGDLLVNELAPRPHNTYHHADRAFATSQFEQLVRAVCDLPLGDTQLLVPSAIVNLLGEVWLQPGAPDVVRALDVPTARLHLYGKANAREGRKMGHLSASGGDAAQAVARVLESYRIMSPGTVTLFDVHDPVLSSPTD
ncbi:MAG TPA: 5-(carboxyamino)imidazole ribonucleotide synthase [Gemmatimonas sp.]|nr:5-(carboxyamino)imidazole ribonucleotide synthase [Gemmatimonas sp.]